LASAGCNEPRGAVLNGLYARIAGATDAKQPRVYHGRGVNGLETGFAGAINLKVLKKAGSLKGKRPGSASTPAPSRYSADIARSDRKGDLESVQAQGAPLSDY
jgi:hypothetical protein